MEIRYDVAHGPRAATIGWHRRHRNRLFGTRLGGPLGGFLFLLAWAPDSTELAVQANHVGSFDLVVYATDGSGPRTIARLDDTGAGRLCMTWPEAEVP